MGFKNSRAKKWLAGALAGVTLSAAALGGFAVGAGAEGSPEIAKPAAGQVIADRGGGEGAEGFEGVGGHAEGTETGSGRGGETGGEVTEAGGESGGERGGEVTEAGGENDTAVALTPGQTYDVTRNGARLVMAYDPAANTFNGTVTNSTNSMLTRARVEIHLSNGTELGPTTPTDLAPGQSLRISLPAGQAPFTTWSPHAEVGNAEAGESGTGGGESAEQAGGHNENGAEGAAG